jgi:Tetratricopeptide repeat/Peptidase C39 family
MNEEVLISNEELSTGTTAPPPQFFTRTSNLFLLLLTPLLLTSCVYWTPMSRDISSSATVIPNVPMQKWDIKSCGAGALSSVLQHYGDTTTMDQWQETLPKTKGGVMSIDLVLAARSKGLDARLVTGDAGMVEGEVRAGRPAILMLQVIQTPGREYDFFHYVVLDGFDEKNKLFRVQFGDGRARWIPLRRLTNAWKGGGYATILIRPKDPLSDALVAAVRLEDEGKYALAANAYREMLDKDPASVIAWTNLGNAENRLGRRVAAEEAYRKAIAIDGQAADALNNLAWMLFEEKRIAEAEPLARAAAAAKAPDSWARLDTLARILAAKGECREAKKTFRKAMDALPPSRTRDRNELQKTADAACSRSRKS